MEEKQEAEMELDVEAITKSTLNDFRRLTLGLFVILVIAVALAAFVSLLF